MKTSGTTALTLALLGACLYLPYHAGRGGDTSQGCWEVKQERPDGTTAYYYTWKKPQFERIGLRFTDVDGEDHLLAGRCTTRKIER